MAKKQEQEKQESVCSEAITLELDCVLTQDDIGERAAQLLRVSNERKAEIGRAGSLRQEASKLKSDAKERDNKALEAEHEANLLLAEIEDLIRAVNDKVEKRQVECVRVLDYKENTLRVTRQDTGEVVEDRKMLTTERQMALGFELQRREQGKEGWLDKRGRLLFVSDGLEDKGAWGVYYRSEQGTLKAFTAKGLESFASRGDAEDGLKDYAEAHGFEYVNQQGEVKAQAAQPAEAAVEVEQQEAAE